MWVYYGNFIYQILEFYQMYINIYKYNIYIVLKRIGVSPLKISENIGFFEIIYIFIIINVINLFITEEEEEAFIVSSSIQQEKSSIKS